MLITEIIGNIATSPVEHLQQDLLELEWFEAPKRIQRKTTNSGIELALKFLREGQSMKDGDILLQNTEKVIVVYIKPCESIVISPKTMLEMGTVCYEIGNKHLPLFIQDDEVLMPYETPMFRWLEATGYQPEKKQCRLLNMLKSNVEPHQHRGSGTSLFSKIIDLASKV